MYVVVLGSFVEAVERSSFIGGVVCGGSGVPAYAGHGFAGVIRIRGRKVG